MASGPVGASATSVGDLPEFPGPAVGTYANSGHGPKRRVRPRLMANARRSRLFAPRRMCSVARVFEASHSLVNPGFGKDAHRFGARAPLGSASQQDLDFAVRCVSHSH